MTAWVLGFVSASELWGAYEFTPTSTEEIQKSVDATCLAHTDYTIAEASLLLVQHLNTGKTAQ